MPTREESIAALLAQPERAVKAKHDVSGLLQGTSIEELEAAALGLEDQQENIEAQESAGQFEEM